MSSPPSPGSEVRARRVAAVLLCAGGASRWQQSAAAVGLAVAHKLLAPLRGRTVVEWAVQHALEAHLDATVVVTGAAILPPRMLANKRITFVHNSEWEQGQAGSLGLALDVCSRLGFDAVVCGLGDQPFLGPEPWQLLGRASQATLATPIGVATYSGARRNPVFLEASVWPMISRVGDEGARPIMRRRPNWVTEVACPGNPADIDTVEDLLLWS